MEPGHSVMYTFSSSFQCHVLIIWQDTEGNTALHVAVLSHRIEAVDILLKAGADPAIRNRNEFTPLLEASKNGFYA